ncbi:hypothetical protein QBC37DRAFT_445567 [Rhypophila decipiens]|uniref:Uncharacterized protein n=1 Tax=Rhypophila decipiens TaxID=261697 RepID=A0AAN7BC23_9PEZI|nr:hypothetical protein QBC37DRAFT_445567 [Rhypophila decipiens]
MSNSTTIAISAASEAACTIAGNPDLLGLGIRLTIYLQTITTALSAAFLDLQNDYLQSSGVTFFIATLAILIREVSNNSIRAPEASCVFWLLVLLVLSLENASRVRSRAYGRQAFRQALLTTAVIYGAWFWFVGVNRLDRQAKGDKEGEFCEEWAFGVAKKQDLRDQNYIKGQKVVYVMASISYGCYVCWYGYQSLLALINGEKDEGDGSNTLAALIKSAKEWADETGSLLAKFAVFILTSGFILFVNGIFLSSIVPAVELQIQWNHIQGLQSLDSVGQLTPLILSVGMLLHVLYSILRDKDGFKEDWEKESAEEIPECPRKIKQAEQHELLERDSRYLPGQD